LPANLADKWGPVGLVSQPLKTSQVWFFLSPTSIVLKNFSQKPPKTALLPSIFGGSILKYFA
jgi:hypothetical protein